MHQARSQHVPARGLIALVFFAATSLALAQGNGSNPKGKPFVEIQGQFVEVVERIDDLEGAMDDVVARVDSLEDRVTANETAIAGLEAENVLINQQISDLIALASANSANIQTALDRIGAAEAEIDALQVDAAANASAILALEAEIDDLQDFVAENTDGLQSLLTRVENNETLIDGLSDEIATINAALLTKQNILNGQCEAGTALTAIDPDGEITCEATGGGITRSTVTRLGTVAAAYSYQQSYSCGTWSTCYRTVWVYPQASAYATCPTGTILSGGSYDLLNSVLTLRRNSSGGNNSWVVTVQNYRTYSQNFLSQAECIRVN